MRALPSIAAILTLVAGLAASTTATAASPGLTSESNDFFSLYNPFEATAASQLPYSSQHCHSSTYQEGLARGVASVMKAYSNGMMDLAKADLIRASGYRMWTQNKLIRIEANQDRKMARLKHRYERQELKRAHAEEMRERQAARGRELAQMLLPRTQFDPTTGEIFWPEAMNRSEFAVFRHDMDRLFRGMATKGPQTDRLYRDAIAQSCQQVRDLLIDQREVLGLDWQTCFVCTKMVRGLSLRADSWVELNDLGYRGDYPQLASN